MESGRERDNKMEILHKWGWETFVIIVWLLTHFLLHSLTMYYLLSVYACVWLDIQSSQTQLAMSCNQGRKLPPATEFWWLALSDRFGDLFSIMLDEFRLIQSENGLSVLGLISDCGCRLKKSFSALHVNPYHLHALEDSGKLQRLWSWRGQRKCVVLPNLILSINCSV